MDTPARGLLVEDVHRLGVLLIGLDGYRDAPLVLCLARLKQAQPERVKALLSRVARHRRWVRARRFRQPVELPQQVVVPSERGPVSRPHPPW